MSNTKLFSRKETRQLVAEAEKAGFVYVDDDTKGHARFLYGQPCAEHATSSCEHRRCVLNFAETPGHGQIKRVRDTIARVTGHKTRGSFDRSAQRARIARQRPAQDARRNYDEIVASIAESVDREHESRILASRPWSRRDHDLLARLRKDSPGRFKAGDPYALAKSRSRYNQLRAAEVLMTGTSQRGGYNSGLLARH